MHGNFSNSISQGMFPNNLNLADITPAHKKGERQDKANYRPVSILSPISKVYERILYNQLYNAFDDMLSISQLYNAFDDILSISQLYNVFDDILSIPQLYNAFDDILSISQCGFRGGYSTQHCLIVMLEKFKKSIDRKE